MTIINHNIISNIVNHSAHNRWKTLIHKINRQYTDVIFPLENSKGDFLNIQYIIFYDIEDETQESRWFNWRPSYHIQPRFINSIYDNCDAQLPVNY